MGFPRGSNDKESACNAGDLGSTLGQEDPLEKAIELPTPVFLPGEFHGQRSLVGYSPGGLKESDTTNTFTHFHISSFGLPWWLSGKEFSGGSCLQCRRCGFYPWIRKISWRRKWHPALVFLAGKSHGQRNLAGYSPWGCKKSWK